MRSSSGERTDLPFLFPQKFPQSLFQIMLCMLPPFLGVYVHVSGKNENTKPRSKMKE